MKIVSLSKEEIIDLISECNSINQVLKKINVNSNGSGAYRTFRNHCESLGVYLPTFKNKGFKIGNKIPLNEILIENSTYQNVSRLKKRLVREGLMEYKCCECGNEGEWMNKPITLQLDHINGINNDNRLDNLRFMCPNCHSQTETFSGKNKKKTKKLNICVDCDTEISNRATRCVSCSNKNNSKVNIDRPPVLTLISDVKNMGYSATGRKYGVSDNTIRNWINK